MPNPNPALNLNPNPNPSPDPTPAISAADPMAEFISRIRSPDDSISGPAWQGAQAYGAAAIEPLAGVLGSEDFEIARNAKRALYRITRHAGRPGRKPRPKPPRAR